MAYRCTFKIDLPWGPKGTSMFYEEAEFDKDSYFVYPEGMHNQGFPTPKLTFEEFFTVVSRQFKPARKEAYFALLPDLGVMRREWSDSELDQKYFEIGNCFKKQADAREAAKRIKELLIRLHDELQRTV